MVQLAIRVGDIPDKSYNRKRVLPMSEYRKFFEVRERASGESFVTLTDDAPDWLRDAVYEAHDDEMPNDWRYQVCADIFESLDLEPEGDAFELADVLADVYTGDLFSWYGDHLARQGYADVVMERGGLSTVFEVLRQGQVEAIAGMVEVLQAAVRDNQPDDDDVAGVK